MSGPEPIWAWWEYDIDHRAVKYWSEYHDEDQKGKFDYAEYVRRDPAVLAALPEVQALIAGAYEAAAKLAVPEEQSPRADQTEFAAGCRHNGLRLNAAIRALTPAAAIAARDAMIAEAVKAEREACARMVDCGCEKGQKAAVIDPKNGADRARACGQYNCGAEDAAAIRKRGEG